MTKKTLAKKIKSFLKPSEPEDNMPDLAARLDALERKVDQILARLASLPSEVRNAVQSNQRPHAPQAQNFPRASQPSQSVRPVSQPPRFVPPSPAMSSGTGAGARPNRRDRELFKAVCADCSQDCEVPIKPTEGRPVYCKPCFAVRKAAKTLPAKSPDRNEAASGISPVTPQAAAPAIRNSAHVPPQIHNMARRSAVAYLAKKAGHLPASEVAASQQAPVSAPVSSGASPARSSRSKPSRNERPKPRKRSR